MKKDKEFVTIKSLLTFINDRIDKINEAPDDLMQIERREVMRGDEWYSEVGYEYLIFFQDKTACVVGHAIITEDDEDWGQAESYDLEYCCDYHDEKKKNIPPAIIKDKIEQSLTAL